MLVPVQATVFFRSGTCVQADLLTLMKRLGRQGSFAPRELPRFIATMAPSDSRPYPAAVIYSCRQSLGPDASDHRIRSGLSGSSLNYRRPLSPLTPGSPSAAYARCFTDGVRFRPFWKVDHYHLRNEAETGSRFRITADVFAFSDFDDEVTRVAAESASW